MNDDMKAEIRQMLLDRYEETADEEYLRAAEQLADLMDDLLAIGAKDTGRPKINDNAALWKAARLKISGKAKSEHAALQAVAPSVEGNSVQARLERLRKKYRKDRPVLDESARLGLRIADDALVTVRVTNELTKTLTKRWRKLLGKTR